MFKLLLYRHRVNHTHTQSDRCTFECIVAVTFSFSFSLQVSWMFLPSSSFHVWLACHFFIVSLFPAVSLIFFSFFIFSLFSSAESVCIIFFTSIFSIQFQWTHTCNRLGTCVPLAFVPFLLFFACQLNCRGRRRKKWTNACVFSSSMTYGCSWRKLKCTHR